MFIIFLKWVLSLNIQKHAKFTNSFYGGGFFLSAFYFEFILDLGNSLSYVFKKQCPKRKKTNDYIVPWIENIQRVQTFLFNVKILGLFFFLRKKNTKLCFNYPVHCFSFPFLFIFFCFDSCSLNFLKKQLYTFFKNTALGEKNNQNSILHFKKKVRGGHSLVWRGGKMSDNTRVL